MTFVRLTTDKWRELHEPNKEVISVTSLIQYMGYGYASRAKMFQKGGEEEKKRNEYTKRCLDYGNVNEVFCLQYLEKYLSDRYHFFKGGEGISQVCIGKDGHGLLGTVDCFLRDKATGALGVLEIKCPFGNKFGKFDQEQVEASLEEKLKTTNFRHWLQLQLYLFMNEKYNAQFGIIVYYYPKFCSVDDAAYPVAYIIQLENVSIEVGNRLEVEEYFQAFFKEDFTAPTFKKAPKKPLDLIRIVRIERLQGGVLTTMERTSLQDPMDL